jgi:cold shock CspA family protein
MLDARGAGTFLWPTLEERIVLKTMGRIVSWKDDKAYGFIAADNGIKQYFVHISAFGNIPRPPRIGDTVEFQIATLIDGKQKAVNASIDGLQISAAERFVPTPKTQPPRPRTVRASRPMRQPQSRLGVGLVAFPLAIAAGIWGYGWFQSARDSSEDQGAGRADSRWTSEPQFRCAGKVYCSEMTSCEEATFYLRNCPGTKMDGDHDGIPCESQWCGR